MSAFETTTTTTTTDQLPENYFEHLVGEGKKFDGQEALAKGKYESDLHVANLEHQIGELREDIDQGTKITELLEMVRKQNEPPKEDPNKSPVVPGDTSSGQMTEDELKSLIETHVSERDTQSLRARNLVEADKALEEKFGESAGRVLHDRAVRMDMSVEEMKTLASQNPKAFYRLMGMDTTSNESGNFVGGGNRSEGVQIKNVDTRNFEFYQDLRRKDKAKYHTPAMQQKMMADRTSMGSEAFYSNS